MFNKIILKWTLLWCSFRHRVHISEIITHAKKLATLLESRQPSSNAMTEGVSVLVESKISYVLPTWIALCCVNKIILSCPLRYWHILGHSYMNAYFFCRLRSICQHIQINDQSLLCIMSYFYQTYIYCIYQSFSVISRRKCAILITLLSS